nr:hypothetical protein [Paraburkholderia hospita]
MIWRHTSFDAKYDGLGQVDFGSTSGTTGRIGLCGSGPSKPAATGYGSPMAASIYGTIGCRPNTQFGSEQIPLREEATRMELAGGVTALLSPNFSIYAQAGYQFAVDNTDGRRRQGACRVILGFVTRRA